jgi:hypothetical protein
MKGAPMGIDADVALLSDLKTIRTRCNEIYQLGLANKLQHFRVHSDKLAALVDFVVKVTNDNYPDHVIPYHSRWSHFNVAGINRMGWLRSQLSDRKTPPLEQTRIYYDLVVPSILLDAGAGMSWGFQDLRSGQRLTKSEGLAVASFEMFADGLFSSDPKLMFKSDSRALETIGADVLANGLQVSKENPIVGLEGRISLLKNLGVALQNKEFFAGDAEGRVGAMVDYLINNFGAKEIRARDVFGTVLQAFGGIWPGRISLSGHNLGDVWKHSFAKGVGSTAGLVPFHKLSQWMTYSLLEPLEWAGIKITGVDELTGLAEYRNGGLFIDMGVLQPTKHDYLDREWSPGDEFVVEWRALTVALLDVVGDLVRKKLGKSSIDLPLAKILQGGTWSAGRIVAAQKRKDGGPPVKIKSDGTVF